jgi:hypothetical protein
MAMLSEGIENSDIPEERKEGGNSGDEVMEMINLSPIVV